MTLILDMGSSDTLIENGDMLPAWLDREWLDANAAVLICELSAPDHLSKLRGLVPVASALVAYPKYHSLYESLAQDDRTLLMSVFMHALGGTHVWRVRPHSPPPAAPEAIVLPAVDANSPLPSLALVSPLPPDASGIANYCAEILPALEKHYDITLVVREPAAVAAALAQDRKIISHNDLLLCGARFDRVMYHFGNAYFHYDYFTLLKAHPGVVVLHDVYLGDCIISNSLSFGSTQLLQYIYASHGWPALQECGESVYSAISLYPSCGEVLTNGCGVILHNRSAREQLELYFSAPLLDTVEETVLAREIRTLPDRQTARDQLGFAKSDILFGSFGLINPNKCIEQLLVAWRQSGLADNPAAVLCLVGGCEDSTLKERIYAGIAALPRPDRVIVTGFADQSTYDAYLGAVDVAVQLRSNSRGESSAALLDAMAAGLPTIVNAHGSMAEMPRDTVHCLKDNFTSGELAAAISEMSALTASESRLGQSAKAYIEEAHSPKKVASSYANLIEGFYKRFPEAGRDRVFHSIVAHAQTALSGDDLWRLSSDFEDLMSCTTPARHAPTGPQLLVDISAIVQHDLESGIQRVVRNILRELLCDAYSKYRIEAIYYDFESGYFRYARTFTNDFLSLPPLQLSDDSVEACPGDIYLGLDLHYMIAGRTESRKWFQYWRGRGVGIYNVIYDLMPLKLPDCFPPDHIHMHEQWLRAITVISDGIVCISRAVADDYIAWMMADRESHHSTPHVGYFHPGAELESSRRSMTPDREESAIIASICSEPYLLMVGSVEQRKGHEQVLSAMQLLWDRGIDLQLVIVGTTRRVDESLKARLSTMSTRSRHLHWLDFVSDAMLAELYANAAGTIMASLGEGFGLPLIEAAYHGSPLLARDLPVFREVCGENAWYFAATDAEGLSRELQQWLDLVESSAQPAPQGMTCKDWPQSTRELMDSVIRQRWYRHGGSA